jgi:asparagine synthase (glutamine-hydrolysing)
LCGVAGTINLNQNHLQSIKNHLLHRGPDAQNYYNYNNINLLHTRLSIQDISNGHQPFEYKEWVIVFNGEIYNHLELREEYLKEFVFSTTSDTETLLYMYIKYQDKMFEYLDGMFAFAILNKIEKRLYLARDRAGKKPLYYYQKGDKFLFASELNALKVAIEDISVDEDGIYAYLKSGFFYGDTTPYSGLKELDIGSIAKIDIDTLSITISKYFDILDYYKQDKIYDISSAKEELDRLLKKSIKDRLVSSDLEVGAFLSGGIDSSLVVAIASEYVDNLKSFTVKLDGAFDESHLAKLTANKYNTEHTQLTVSMNLKDDVEKILSNYGEPFMDSSAIPSYYVSREAKKHVTVILNGDGADELFGGYRRYVPIANGMIKWASYISSLSKILPKPHNKKSLYNYGYRLLAMANKRDLDFYLSATNDIFEDTYRLDNNHLLDSMNSYIKEINNQDITSLSKMLYIDFNLLLKNDLLKKMDIATMAHSLEGRSPFLSKYMLEFAPRLSDNLKIKGTTTKYILRELSKKYLPSELITQPKRGFEVPLKGWVESELKENIYDTLSSNSYSSNYIKQDYIDKLLDKRVDVSDEKRAKMLWSMYALDVWYKSI